MKLPVRFAAYCSTLLLAVSGHARTGSGQDPSEERTISLGVGLPAMIALHGYAGIAVGAQPDYEGAGDYSVVAQPLVDLEQAGLGFIRGATVNPNDGYGSAGWHALNLVHSVRGRQVFRLSVGPMVRFNRGRDADDHADLAGLGDIDDSVGAGGFVAARLGEWRTMLSAVSQDAGNAGDGLPVSLQTAYQVRVGPRLTVAPGAYVTWVDDVLAEGYYGVTATQAARSGLPRYDAKAGVKDAGLVLGLHYGVSRHLSLRGEVGYQRLLGDAADSPIVSPLGERDQYRALLGVVYEF